MSLVVVNDTQVNEIISRGQRVVTYEMVASVHGISADTVRESYRKNSEHFVQDKHTWIVEGDELQELKNSTTISGRVPTLRVFSELGYYMLVKPMRDKTSWSVQGEMAETYFKVKHLIQAQLPPPLTVQDQIAAIKDVYEFMSDIGLADDYTRIMAKDALHNHIRMLGNPGGQILIPQTTDANHGYFQIEELRGSLPKMSDKQWFELRGTFGKVVRLAIQAVDPTCQPYKIDKLVNGSVRPVNMWSSEYRDIAIAAIERHMERLANSN